MRMMREYFYPPGTRSFEIAHLAKDIRIWVNLGDKEGANLYFGVLFEPLESRIIRTLLRPGDVFLDVGANVGQYSLMVSPLVGVRGAVHSFEPVSSTYELLLKNVQLNQASNVVVNRMAVGEKMGEVQVFVNQESGLTSRGNTNRGIIVSVEQVPCITIDNYVAQQEIISVDLLKIDVEGYEGQVLEGAEDLLRREDSLIVLCELSPKNFERLDWSRDDIFEWVRKHDYDIWSVDDHRPGLVRIQEGCESPPSPNFIFARPAFGHRLDSMNLD